MLAVQDDPAVRVRALRTAGLAAKELGRLDEGLAHLKEALHIAKHSGLHDAATLAGLLADLGSARASKGQLRAAEALLAEAISVAGQVGLRSLAATARGKLALVLSRRGDVPGALRLYAAAEPDLPVDRVARCRMDQAETLIGAGLAGEARLLLVRTLAEASTRHDVADGLLLLAHAELADGDPERAAATAEQARAEFAAQDRTGWMLLAEHLLLRARWAAGDRSPVFFRTAVATADRLDQGGWAVAAADARILAARLALHLGRPARPLLEQVGRARLTRPAALRVAAWHATALERWAEGDRRGATAAVWAGLQVAEENAELLGAVELRARAAGICADLAEFGLRQARSARELLVAEERRRAIARRPTTVRPPADPERTALLAILRAASAEPSSLQDEPSARLQHERSPRTNEHVIRLEAAVRARTHRQPAASAAPFLGSGRVQVAELMEALGEERALVELVRVGEELVAVTVAGGRCQRWGIGAYEMVEREVRLVRFALGRLNRGADAEGFAHAVRQADRRVPLELCRAVGERELVIAPTGALHGLPWAVLPGMGERPFTVVPSAAAWLRAYSERGCGGADQVVLASGPGLVHAEAELTALSGLYPRATVLRRCTVGEVLGAFDGAGVAHVAAHGEFRADNALFSHLRLADGPLMAYDLEDLAAVPRTVVLSACDAGRADLGDGVMGFVGVLLGLGAASVVASVVPVTDARARTLMTGFHGLLPQEGPAQALARVPRSPGDLGFMCFGVG